MLAKIGSFEVIQTEIEIANISEENCTEYLSVENVVRVKMTNCNETAGG